MLKCSHEVHKNLLLDDDLILDNAWFHITIVIGIVSLLINFVKWANVVFFLYAFNAFLWYEPHKKC